MERGLDDCQTSLEKVELAMWHFKDERLRIALFDMAT
jgi:hypothetical protein